MPPVSKPDSFGLRPSVPSSTILGATPKDGPIQEPSAQVGFKSWNLSQAAGERCSKKKEA